MKHDDEPVYMISIAARLAGMHPQTLRVYESKELIVPQRTKGRTRLYSARDIGRLKHIQELTEGGLNLAGVHMVLELKDEIEKLNRAMEDRLEELEERLRSEVELTHRRYRRELMVIPKGSLARAKKARGGR